MAKATIPVELTHKHLFNQGNELYYIDLKSLQFTPGDTYNEPKIGLRYAIAQQQIQTSRLSHLNRQTHGLQQDLLTTRKHASNLEQVIQNLRTKTHEKDAKHIDHESLENIATLRAQLQEAQSEIETFSKQYREEKESKQECLFELEAIQGQFKELKKQVLEARAAKDLADEVKNAAEKQTSSLQAQLMQKTEVLNELDREIKSIKELLHEGMKQAKTIEKEYLEAIDDKVSATSANEQLSKNLRQSQEEIRLLKEQLSDANEREQLMQSETAHQLDQIVRQRDQYKNQLKDSIDTLETLRRHFNEVEKSHKSLDEQLKKSEILIREQEHEIKTAHQHLAKKVKETTILSENLEDLKLRLMEAQKSHELDKNRINEFKNKLDHQVIEEKRLQEKIHEAQKHAEEQMNKWEEKFFTLMEKLQQAEARNKELLALEDRHNQMQALLAGLGNFVGNSTIANYTQPAQQQQHAQPIPPSRPMRKPDVFFEEPETLDLFKDLPKQPRNVKKDLFGDS